MLKKLKSLTKKQKISVALGATLFLIAIIAILIFAFTGAFSATDAGKDSAPATEEATVPQDETSAAPTPEPTPEPVAEIIEPNPLHTVTTPAFEGVKTESSGQPSPSGEYGSMPSFSFDFPDAWGVESNTFDTYSGADSLKNGIGGVTLTHSSGLRIVFSAKLGMNGGGGVPGATVTELAKTQIGEIALVRIDTDYGSRISLQDLAAAAKSENVVFGGGCLNFAIYNGDETTADNIDTTSQAYTEAVAIISSLRITVDETAAAANAADGILGSWQFDVSNDGAYYFEGWTINADGTATCMTRRGTATYQWHKTDQVDADGSTVYSFDLLNTVSDINAFSDQTSLNYNAATDVLSGHSAVFTRTQ